jgi:hypothetical protein
MSGMGTTTLRPPGSTLLVLTLLAVIFSSQQAIAQESPLARIKLQNGQVVKGFISGCTDDGRMQVDFQKSPAVTIGLDDIRKIKFLDGYAHAADSTIGLAAYDPLKIGKFFHQLDVGLQLSSENTDYALHIINGYQFNQFLGTGLGLGMEQYGDFTTLPLFAQVRGYLRNHRVTPFYHGSVGYGFAWYDNPDNVNEVEFETKGGLYWEIGVGYKVHFKPLSLLFNLGYKQQVTVRDFESPHYYAPWSSFRAPGSDSMEISEKTTFRRLSFGVGVLF